jgi:AcrR family transcriptional regulator
MSQATHGSIATEWLGRITDHILENGLADASLRRLAQVAGTSHPHLRYYFGSRTGLLGAVLHALRERESAQLVGQATSREEALHNIWQYFTSPSHQLEMQLFFQVAGSAVQDPHEHADFIDSVSSSWVMRLTDLAVLEGVPPTLAEQEARAALAALRGLLLDRLLTADTAATDAAWYRLVTLLTQTRGRRP